jgi:hypothetical protein
MKYNRGKYGMFVYGGTFGFINYTQPTKPTTNYTLQSRPNTGWGIANYNTYGLEYGKTTRIRYGDHVQFAYPIIDYKFIPKANFSTDF